MLIERRAEPVGATERRMAVRTGATHNDTHFGVKTFLMHSERLSDKDGFVNLFVLRAFLVSSEGQHCSTAASMPQVVTSIQLRTHDACMRA